ncbi:MAG: hypothetical protein KC561_05925, partial [Myxococcales bacterium]|nr:hypothetical protein [Myxococcales bacterium]
IETGRYEDGKIDFLGHLELRSTFEITLGPVTARFLQGARLTVCVEDSAFKYAELTGLQVEADIALAQGTMLLAGTLERGRYENGQIDFLGSISLRQDFSYSLSPLTATLKAQSTLRVNVEQNEFKWAELQNVVLDVDVTIPGAESPLKLRGTITQGRYENGKISFQGRIELRETFVYTLGSVTARFMQGASLEVCVEENEFKWAELAGLVIEVDVDLGQAHHLQLRGALERGRYENGKIDLLGSITLMSRFDYSMGPISVALLTGTIRVDIQQSEFQRADIINVQAEASVTVQGKTLRLGGTLNGAYYDDKIDVDASISLLDDFDYEVGPVKATLRSGGTVRVKIERSEFKWAALENVVGDVVLTIGDKEVHLRGTITSGKYWDSGKIDLDATIELISPVVLIGGGTFTVTLTSASVHFVVTQSELTSLEANGRADVAVDMGGQGNVSGWLQVNWRREGGQNYFSGAGKVTVEMLDGKLHGEVDAELQENGNWNIHGKITYEMNKFVKGEIDMTMDQDLDPILDGTLTVDNVELMAGRDLFKMDVPIIPWTSTTVVIVAVPITLGFGCDFGFKVSMLPVTFSAAIGIQNFRPRQLNVPDFSVRADINTGLNVSLALKPYATLGVGIANILDAGFKLKGGIELNAPITVNPYLLLEGRGGQFSGELGVNVAVSPTVSLSVQGALYAAALGQDIEYEPDWLHYQKDFGDLFSWEWNAAYKFGDRGNETASSSAPPSGDVQGSPTEVQEMEEKETEGLGGEFAGEPQRVQDDPEGPVMDQESTNSPEEPSEGPMAEFKQKMETAQEWAEHVGNVANLIGFVASALGLTVALSFLGPFAPLVAFIIAIIMAGGPGKLMDGVSSLFWIIGHGAAILWDLMPDWVHEVVDEIQKIIDNGADYAIDKFDEWAQGALGIFYDAAVPLIDWCRNTAERFAQAMQNFDGSLGGTIGGIIDFVLAGVSGIRSLFGAIEDMWDEFSRITRKLVEAGNIVACDMNTDDFAKDPWKWKADIPGIGHWEGPDTSDWGGSDDTEHWGIGNLASTALKNVFGIPRSHTSGRKKGFYYNNGSSSL